MNKSITHQPKIKMTILMASDFCQRIRKVFTPLASLQATQSPSASNDGGIGSLCKGLLGKDRSLNFSHNTHLSLLDESNLCYVSVSFLIFLPCLHTLLYYYTYNLQLKKIIVYISLHTGTNFISKLNEMIVTNENEIANK